MPFPQWMTRDDFQMAAEDGKHLPKQRVLVPIKQDVASYLYRCHSFRGKVNDLDQFVKLLAQSATGRSFANLV